MVGVKGPGRAAPVLSDVLTVSHLTASRCSSAPAATRWVIPPPHHHYTVISDALYDTTASIRFWIFLIKLSFVYSTSFVWNCGNVVPRIRSACPATPAGRAPAPVPALVPACLHHELRHGYPVETHASSVVQSHLPIVFKWYWLSFHFIMDVKYVTERFVSKISFKDIIANYFN